MSGRWLVTGATGQVGSHVVNELVHRSAELIVLVSSRPPPDETGAVKWKDSNASTAIRHLQLDLSKPPEMWQPLLQSVLEEHQVNYVVHCAALCNVQQAFDQQDAATAINTTATIAIAAACKSAARGGSLRKMVYCSTDMVFGGGADGQDPHHLYTEDDTPIPLSHYGRSKLAGEKVVNVFDRAVVARLPLMFGLPAEQASAADGRYLENLKTTFASQLRTMISLQPSQGFEDEFRTPLSLRDAATCLLRLAIDDSSLSIPNRLVHIAGPERMSRFDMLVALRSALQLLASRGGGGGTGEEICRRLAKLVGVIAEKGREGGEEDQDAESLLAARRFVNEIEKLDIRRVSRNSFPSSEPRALNLSMSGATYQRFVEASGCGKPMRESVLEMLLALVSH